LILVAIVALWLLPKWQVAGSAGLSSKNRFDRENEARTTLAQIIGGVLLLAGLYSSVQTFDLQREGQITDRYTKAVDQLGSMESGKPNLTVRLGGIYALERISRDSPKDRATIMEVLSAYVRQNAPAPKQASNAEEVFLSGAALHEYLSKLKPPQEDIQAILTVIGRREATTGFPIEAVDLHSTSLQRADLEGAHLEGAGLIGAHLEEAFLVGARLGGAHFDGARLEGAQLEGAYLEDAHLEGAGLEGAALYGAHLEGARLEDAHLDEAHLGGADLDGTDLFEANLSGADLRGAIGLTQDQLNSAYGDDKTLLPHGLERPNSWRSPHP
jgi:uncharacterized protein YjbI with pentapeptide repeats